MIDRKYIPSIAARKSKEEKALNSHRAHYLEIVFSPVINISSSSQAKDNTNPVFDLFSC